MYIFCKGISYFLKSGNIICLFFFYTMKLKLDQSSSLTSWMNNCSSVLWSELYWNLCYLDPMASYWLKLLHSASTLLKAPSARSGGTTWSVLAAFISSRDALHLTGWLVKIWAWLFAHVTNQLYCKLHEELNSNIQIRAFHPQTGYKVS